MARPSTASAFNIAQLERLLQDRRTELTRLERQRESLSRKIDGIDRQIVKLGGTRGDLGVRKRPHAFPQRLGRLAQVEVQGSQFRECSSRSTHVSCASAWRSL